LFIRRLFVFLAIIQSTFKNTSTKKIDNYTKSWIWQYAKRHEREVAKKEAESQNNDDDSRLPLSDVGEENPEETNGDDDIPEETNGEDELNEDDDDEE